MERFGGGGDTQQLINSQDPNQQLGSNSSGGALFDASQYAFFGNEVLEEVELGGLENDEDDLPAAKFEEEDYLLEQEEGVFPEIDDLSSTFTKLNKDVMGPSVGFFGSRESSSAAEWAHGRENINWMHDQDVLDASMLLRKTSSYDSNQYLHRTSSYPDQHPQQNLDQHPQQNLKHHSIDESNILHRTSSYPEQQQHLNQHFQFSSDPVPVPKTSFISYPPPPGGSPQFSPNHQSQYLNAPYHTGGPQMGGMPHGSQFGGNLSLSQFRPPAPTVNNRLQNQFSGNLPDLSNGMMQQRFTQNGTILPPQQHRMYHQFLPPFGGQLSGLQPPMSPPPMMNNFEPLGMGYNNNLRPKSGPKGRLGPGPNQRYFQSGFDTSGWPQFRSKYMSSDEIENIIRMQLAATHSNDPYVDDYYHQACLANKSSGAKLRHHFCPTQLRDPHSKARTANEPHAFLQVDALGRISFSSIRRPRPLLEVDPLKSTGGGTTDQKILDKPLEQEPMLAARVTIEDGICLLLDVDDIDRFLQFNQLQDGGSQLRQRREVLLEGLATSLQLVDPLGKTGQTVESAMKDNFVFLRIASLPKGRKLLSSYLKHLPPNSEWTRVVCMAVFRHLRFFFGVPPVDPGAAETLTNLVMTISSSLHAMELKSLGACLASVVCSLEQPPLRPIGSHAGDGASLLLKTVLESATELLTNPNAVTNCSPTNRDFWQASFDAFFGLLTKYCFSKYDTLVQSDMAVIGSDAAAKALSREIPVELLRASLPHTNENQRKLLLDFAQRST